MEKVKKATKKFLSLTAVLVILVNSSIISTAKTTNDGFTVESADKADRAGKPVILDTDIGGDVDDACAVRIAGALDLAGVIDLKAVTMSANEHNNMDIKGTDGLLKTQGITDVLYGKCETQIETQSSYLDGLAKYSDGNYEVYDSVKLWRKVIAESDRPVDICTTGYMMNLANFCKSQPDEISDKTGMELLNEKVGNIYITGCMWPGGLENNVQGYKETRDAFDWILNNVDKPLLFITHEVGGKIKCGKQIVDIDSSDILSKALIDYGTPNGREAWDPMTMYICGIGNSTEVLKNNGFSVMKVDITFDRESGENEMAENPNGKHYRIYRTYENLDMYGAVLDKLCTLRNKEDVNQYISSL